MNSLAAYYHRKIRTAKGRRGRDLMRWPIWQGIQTAKYASDLLAYQQIIYDTRPDIIVETGTRFGGSTLYFAHICDIVGHGSVVSIDIDNDNARRKSKLPVHPRITYMSGSSIDEKIIKRVHKIIDGPSLPSTCMITLDSNHHRDHVIQELEAYCGIVPSGYYLVVEDTHLNGHPNQPEYGPGPWEAVEDFMSRHGDEFERVPWEHRLVLTQNPGGWLRRK